MNRVFAIAQNTFREAVRNKVLYALLVFGIGVILFALPLGQMSLSEQARVTRDVGLAGIELFGILISVFIGVNLVHKEIDRKTIYALVPKPLHRYEFIIGKYLGIVATLLLMVAIMSIMLLAVLFAQEAPIESTLIRAITMLFVELMVVTAVAIFFSSFSTPFLSGLFTLVLCVIGLSTDSLRILIKKLPAALQFVAGFALRLLPDLRMFYVSGTMLDGRWISIHQGNYVDWSYVALATAYGMGYATVILLLSMWIFSRRDFI
ncbi:MAG: ABC transporter permease [Myxococcales bacterium]|nr:ABC transporter permease [Myxococcota bacterium]MDW8280556.1 ABC transporter permease [Myxococcales bacterium]